jgi:hypothetical protein
MRAAHLLTLAVAVALGACGAVRPVPPPCPPRADGANDVPAAVEPGASLAPAPETGVPQRPTDLEELARYLARAKNRQPAELQLDLEVSKAEFTATGSEASRVRLAYIYLQPGTSFRNETLALKLLQPYVRGDAPPGSPYRGIAQLLLDGLSDVRRAEAALQVQIAKARDEQRRADELERKLDALKDVERAMILKDQKSGNKR